MRNLLILFAICLLPFSLRAAGFDVDEARGLAAEMLERGMADTQSYKELRAAIDEYDRLVAEYESAQARENSAANKLITGASIGMMGIGLSQAAQGMAEKSADDRWAQTISSLKDSFRCSVRGQPPVDGGEEGTMPPYTEKFNEMRLAYVGNDTMEGLAGKVKRYKEILGLRPGIESEIDTGLDSLDQRNRTLYSNESRARDEFTGGFATAAERAESGEAGDRVQRGTGLAVGGAAIGVGGNLLVNEIAPGLGAGKKNE